MKNYKQMDVISDPVEIAEYMRFCKHEWEEVTISHKLLNPNGECVVGYGFSPVMVPDKKEIRCTRCQLPKRFEDARIGL